MILPQTYTAALLLMVLAVLCQGSWAHTLKLAGRSWRFELYYFDFAVGLMAAALVCGFTLGSMGFDGFALMDDFLRAGKRQWLFGFLAGLVFNLANMLLAGAISVAGVAVAFPLAAGITLLGSAIWMGLNAPVNPFLLIAACLLILVAVAVDAAAYYLRTAGQAKKGSRPRYLKPLILCGSSGVLGALVYPMMDWARAGEAGLGPYGAAIVFSGGILASTVVFDLFFMNLPVAGEPLEILDYFHGGLKVHGFGLLGGIVWCAGLVAAFVVAGAPLEVQPRASALLAISQGGLVVAALWGLLA
ncbi:MAG TPA: hypothetical protein VGH38_19175, partial [Bryobacteraceae bacterium]